MEVHVVSKKNNKDHASFALGESFHGSLELAPSSVRVRPAVISLTSNNLSYARGGDFLHWYTSLPFPINPITDNVISGGTPTPSLPTPQTPTTTVPPGASYPPGATG